MDFKVIYCLVLVTFAVVVLPVSDGLKCHLCNLQMIEGEVVNGDLSCAHGQIPEDKFLRNCSPQEGQYSVCRKRFGNTTGPEDREVFYTMRGCHYQTKLDLNCTTDIWDITTCYCNTGCCDPGNEDDGSERCPVTTTSKSPTSSESSSSSERVLSTLRLFAVVSVFTLVIII